MVAGMSFPWRGRLPAIRTTVRLRQQPGKRFGMTAEVPAKAVPGLRGPAAPLGEGERRRDGARSSLVRDVLQGVIAARVASLGRGARAELDIVDVGGGTGGFAVPFAALGHRVTVVDPSP